MVSSTITIETPHSALDEVFCPYGGKTLELDTVVKELPAEFAEE